MTEPKVWTEEEAEYIKANYYSAPREEMLAKLNVPWQKIKDKARKLKLSRPRVKSDREGIVKDYERGMHVSAIMEKYDVAATTIYTALSVAGTERRNPQLDVSLHDFGMDVLLMNKTEVAKKYDISRPTVYAMIDEGKEWNDKLATAAHEIELKRLAKENKP